MLNIDITQVCDHLPVLIGQTIAGNDVFITQSVSADGESALFRDDP